MSQTVCVIGLGYIGLPTASFLATKGFRVHGVDTNSKVIESLNRGEVIIHEPSLDVLVKSAVQSGYLKASSSPVPSDIFVISVPTPFYEDRSPDLSYVERATKSIAPFLSAGNLVILESTSPVGTTEMMAGWIREARPDLRTALRDGAAGSEAVLFAHCPERVLPGKILQELVENDRIVGGIDAVSTKAAAQFYRTFVSGKVIETDSRTAELSKLAENTFRDVNIAFANELALVCEKLGVSPWQVIEMANRHPRVNILKPGPGVGGHCIAVDPWFIVHSAPEETHLIRSARKVNDSIPHRVVARVKAALAQAKGREVLCLGLAYKADVDDLRESPSMEVVKELAAEKGLSVSVVEPFIEALPKDFPSGVRLEVLSEAVLQKADCIVLLVDHTAFKDVPAAWRRGKPVVDTRGIWIR